MTFTLPAGVVLVELCLVWRRRRKRRRGHAASSRQHPDSQLRSHSRSHMSGPISRTSGHPSRATSSFTTAKPKGVPSHTYASASAISAGAPGSSRQPSSEAAAPRVPDGGRGGSPCCSSDQSVQLDLAAFANLTTAREKVADAMAQMQAALRAELQDDSLLIYSVLGRGASGTLFHGARFCGLPRCSIRRSARHRRAPTPRPDPQCERARAGNWRDREAVLRTMLFQSGGSGGERDRFAAEAATARALEHSSVVATLWYELCNVTGQGTEELDIYKLYLIQEHCNGGTLRDVLERGTLAVAAVGDRWRLAVSLLERVALGMEHLHSHDVVHGELCPSQILLQVRAWLGLGVQSCARLAARIMPRRGRCPPQRGALLRCTPAAVRRPAAPRRAHGRDAARGGAQDSGPRHCAAPRGGPLQCLRHPPGQPLLHSARGAEQP